MFFDFFDVVFVEVVVFVEFDKVLVFKRSFFKKQKPQKLIKLKVLASRLSLHTWMR